MRFSIQPIRAFSVLFLVMIFTCFTICGTTFAKSADENYAKKSTWQETMQSLRGCVTSEDIAVLDFGDWYTTGPLKAKEFSDPLFPEQNVDLNQTRNEQDNKTKVWQKQQWPDGKVHALQAPSSSSTYLYRVITSNNETVIPLGFGSDDGLEVWLNQKKIISRNVPRGAAPNQDEFLATLTPGKNELLIKIFNISGNCGFYFSAGQETVGMKLWAKVKRDFPVECGWFENDFPPCLDWFITTDTTEIEQFINQKALSSLGEWGLHYQKEFGKLQNEPSGDTGTDYLDLYVNIRTFKNLVDKMQFVNFETMELAIRDMAASFPDQFTQEHHFLDTLHRYKKSLENPELVTPELIEEILAFKKDVLLSNPLLDFEKLLLVRRNVSNARSAMGASIGMTNNWVSNSAINPRTDSEIAILSPVRPEGKVETLYRPENSLFVGDVDLDFDAERMLFSMPAKSGHWQIFQIDADGTNLQQLPLIEDELVSNYDGCYLPDGNVVFTSTATMVAVPCIGGDAPVTNLFLWNKDKNKVRRLSFDQEHNWCPTVLHNGRVLYTRWEYTDTPHYFSRLLFHCNPDGTEQMEYYGSNSYFPNSIFYARPIPNHPTAVVAIISGHHGIARSGRLLIFDPAQSRFEANGVVQEIPHRGVKVEPLIKDELVNGVWPQFLHPYPLNDTYFLVSAKLTPDSLWGVYLVDTFDNMTLVKEIEGAALLEPVPMKKQKKPPVIPNRVDENQQDAVFYITDIYAGPGLKDIPRGTVKDIRLYTYSYGYNHIGGHEIVGHESTWDVRRMLGTVSVENDGSALFRAPANMPLVLQPLDDEGRALQLMQSWTVGQPGEIVSCIGCHEAQNMVPPNKPTVASRKIPSEIEPWNGPARPFAYRFEVQPVLDKYCVSCHNGHIPDRPVFTATGTGDNWKQDQSYLSLHPFVRRPGPEGDYHLFQPMEYHASTSELIQMLEKGHHGVKIAQDDIERIYTWIDLNVPYLGQWTPPKIDGIDQAEYRAALLKKYANVDLYHEQEYSRLRDKYLQQDEIIPVEPEMVVKPDTTVPQVANWPFDAKTAQEMQQQLGRTERAIDLGNHVQYTMAAIPSGQFAMGDVSHHFDELPMTKVSIDQPFWMGTCEITNTQYAQFDPAHDSRYYDQHWKDHTRPGYPANLPNQPVIRISWQQANAFCDWLTKKTGKKFRLPTEAEWEWACRAGSASAMWFGGQDDDFSPYANLADTSLSKMAVTGVDPQPMRNPNPIYTFIPRIESVNDNEMLAGLVGSYKPNPWGLHDMHGNVCEWTLSSYQPYPYIHNDGRNNPLPTEDKVVRGGSWRDRPKLARSSYRLAYKPYQRVYNVGFRVVMEDDTLRVTSK
jgi:formylglycine-generating enzyme required for sulfatase activity